MSDGQRDEVAIWNRAAAEELSSDARDGDRALHAVLEFHGYAMNSGLDHAFDLSGWEAQGAVAGWELLERRDVADLLRGALQVVPDMPDDREARQHFFVDRWTNEQAEKIEKLGALYPEDEVVEQAFAICLRTRPECFAPSG